MRMIPDPTGRFTQRPFYAPEELDNECEQLIGKFLRELYHKVEYPVRTDDLTKLIERYVDDFDPYADLAAQYGEGVEGVTEFHPGKKPDVRIEASLSNARHRENRLRTTLTHELGHVRYHAWLFDVRNDGDLFSRQPRGNDIQVCKRETMIDAPQRDWMEWQAGHVCGAILMPASHVRRLAKEIAAAHAPPDFEPVTPDTQFGAALISKLVERFQVSREAAQVRLLRLNVLSGL